MSRSDDIEEDIDDYVDENFEEGGDSNRQEKKDSANALVSSGKGPAWLEAESHEKDPSQAGSPSPARSDANSDLMLVTSPSPSRNPPGNHQEERRQLAAGAGDLHPINRAHHIDDSVAHSPPSASNPLTQSTLQDATTGSHSEATGSKPSSSRSQTTATSRYSSMPGSRRSSHHSATATQVEVKRRSSVPHEQIDADSTQPQTFNLTAVAQEGSAGSNSKKTETYGGPVLRLQAKSSSSIGNPDRGTKSATPQEGEKEGEHSVGRIHPSPALQDSATLQPEELRGAAERKSVPKIAPRMNRTASTHARMTSKELIEEARRKKESEDRREAALHEAELEKRKNFLKAEKLRFQRVLEQEKQKLKERLLAFEHSFPDSDLDEETLLMEAVTPDPSPARDHHHYAHPGGNSKTPQPTSGSSVPHLPPLGKKPVRSSYTALQVVDPAIADFIFGGKVRVAKVPHHFIAQQRAKAGSKSKAAFKF